jgi:Amidohydrolase family
MEMLHTMEVFLLPEGFATPNTFFISMHALIHCGERTLGMPATATQPQTTMSFWPKVLNGDVAYNGSIPSFGRVCDTKYIFHFHARTDSHTMDVSFFQGGCDTKYICQFHAGTDSGASIQQQDYQREEPTSSAIEVETDKVVPVAATVVATVEATANQLVQGNDCNAVLDYRHAFYLATLGGTEGLGLLDHIGTLAVGMEFDAIVLSVGNPSDQIGSSLPLSLVQVFVTDTVSEVFQKICVLGDDRNIAQVYVQGRKVIQSKHNCSPSS